MSELIDIFNANGAFVGVAERDVAHAFGLWHRAVHCWVVWDGRLVFQRRAEYRENGGKLYTTASGHVCAGATLEEAFAAETSEEIGFVPPSSRFLFSVAFVADFPKKDGSLFAERVFSHTYYSEYDGALSDFRFNDGEVSAVVAIDLADFARRADEPSPIFSGLEFNGESMREIQVSASDFLVTSGDSLGNKFGRIARAILADMGRE